MPNATSSGQKRALLTLDDLDRDARRYFKEEDLPEELFHYTSLEGAKAIIESKSLRLTKYTYLNDTSEFRHSVDLFSAEADKEIAQGTRTTQEVRLLTSAVSQLKTIIGMNVCIASFCEDGDLLSQWRGYGGIGTSVALAFSPDSIRRSIVAAPEVDATLLKCIYQLETQRRVIRALITALLEAYKKVSKDDATQQHIAQSALMHDFSTVFLHIAPVLKDRHFNAEREWRLVTMPIMPSHPRYQAFISSSRTTTFYLHKFEPAEKGQHDFINRIVVGPMREHELISEAFELHCKSNGLEDCNVHHSSVPFRG